MRNAQKERGTLRSVPMEDVSQYSVAQQESGNVTLEESSK